MFVCVYACAFATKTRKIKEEEITNTETAPMPKSLHKFKDLIHGNYTVPQGSKSEAANVAPARVTRAELAKQVAPSHLNNEM